MSGLTDWLAGWLAEGEGELGRGREQVALAAAARKHSHPPLLIMRAVLNSLSLWTAPIGPFMILFWQLDGAGWLISIISFMILILAARWLSLHAVFLLEFCPHSARI